jgi:hypothetical protein
MMFDKCFSLAMRGFFIEKRLAPSGRLASFFPDIDVNFYLCIIKISCETINFPPTSLSLLSSHRVEGFLPRKESNKTI